MTDRECVLEIIRIAAGYESNPVAHDRCEAVLREHVARATAARLGGDAMETTTTATNIREMLAGREMDAMVHRAIFGGETVALPPYSTDIAAAWSILEAKCFDDADGYNRTYWEVAQTALGYRVEVLTRPRVLHVWADADAAPLAICRAALLWHAMRANL